jgi:hypothetical protein
MFAKEPFPKTTELCNGLLKDLIDSVENPSPFQQTKAKDSLEMLYSRQCKICLSWFFRNYRNHPSVFVQSLAKKAYEYEKSLIP